MESHQNRKAASIDSMDSYQSNFSNTYFETTHNVKGRERKAITIVKVLHDFIGHNLKGLNLLDFGCSTGIIAHYLSSYFREVTGFDIDIPAINFAKKNFNKENLNFIVGKSGDTEFADQHFDVVICTHIYEHVPDARRLMRQIHRLLKPGGVCYFTAGNRLSIMEPHYNLPFLSIIPVPLAHAYLKVMNKGEHYHERHLTFWGLRELVRNFKLIDYTNKIIADPIKFSFEYMLKPGSKKHNLAQFIIKNMYWLSPDYIWLLQKKLIN
jgi:2-polyprenyl-3-methyl-5-hydroxy-6-metoxy-1,4-benzoquinol methylase